MAKHVITIEVDTDNPVPYWKLRRIMDKQLFTIFFEEYSGNISRVADELLITRSTLSKKSDACDLNVNEFRKK